MNFVNFAVNYVKNTIPREVLEPALFDKKHNWRVRPNLDKLIETQLLRPKLFLDMSLIRGVEVTVMLNQCNILYRDEYGIAIEIPPKLLGNRKIVSVLSVLSNLVYVDTGNDSSSGLALANKAFQNTSGSSGGLAIEDVEVVGDFEIFIPMPIDIFDLVLKLNVEYGQNFSEIVPRAFIKLQDGIRFSVESMLYTKLRAKIKTASLYHGYSIDEIETIISEFADAETSYQEFLNTRLHKILFTNDQRTMRNYIRSHVKNNF
jgi:hypothetical protein